MMTKNAEIYEDLTKNIIADLKKGNIPWEKPWFASKPTNAITGKGYSGFNHLNLNMIASKLQLEVSDLRFLTFNQANANGYKIKKGEKSVGKVLYFSMIDKTDAEDQNTLVVDRDKTASKNIPFLKHFPVFHASQVEGIPVYSPAIRFDANNLAEEIIQKSNAKVIKNQLKAFYSPSADLIGMPNIECFKSMEGYYGTLLHELGHWTGHSSRLNRNIENTFGTELYAKEELVAELASIFLCAETGIQYQAGNHQAYINKWIKVLKDDALEIKKASSQAMRIVSYLLGFVKSEAFEVNH
jgi:antirestriction protein ArdC